MALAIFDLDNTLLRGDSDYLWGIYLVDKKLVDPTFHQQQNDKFYQQYLEGSMNIEDFLRFQLAPLSRIPMKELLHFRAEYIQQYILPIITTEAKALVQKHKNSGDTLLIITATNDFVTRPIAELFGIDHLIATCAEIRDGQYTGKVEGIPSYQAGKVTRLQGWLKTTKNTMDGSWFYSDSHNDLPLLLKVDHPVAVNPDKQLEKYAAEAGWPIVRLNPPQ